MLAPAQTYVPLIATAGQCPSGARGRPACQLHLLVRRLHVGRAHPWARTLRPLPALPDLPKPTPPQQTGPGTLGHLPGPPRGSGAPAPSEVARLVLERTDHCLLVGQDAYRFARQHGHAHVELLTEASRQKWLEWRENLSREDDWLPPPPKLPFEAAPAGQGALPGRDELRLARARALMATRPTGTIHVSALAADGTVACTTTTSGLAWKIPGRVGDSPIVGAGLYCDQGVGSAGATGRGGVAAA